MVTEAPAWIEENAMSCLMWLINEVNRNVQYIEESERFYEKDTTDVVPIYNNTEIPSDEISKLKSFNVSLTDGKDLTVAVSEELHMDFINVVSACNDNVMHNQRDISTDAGPSCGRRQPMLLVETISTTVNENGTNLCK